MTTTIYDRLISGSKVLLDEANKANKKGNVERRALMLNDCVEFLTNGLKRKGDLRSKRRKPRGMIRGRCEGDN